ncbi:MAG TPA: glycerophosphodiester phosphodiesterase family protein, partial [Burkholderiaceae bacterium]
MTRPTADWPYPFWIAHRGAGRRAPENTLAAFREGASQGFRMFECDVKLSADDVPFLLHDSELGRTTSGTGRAGDLPWSELARLDAGAWLHPRWAGEPPATLEAVARFVR